MTAPQQQKLRMTGPMVVTANRLGDGAVVYRTSDNGWSTALATAAVMVSEADAVLLLKEALADETRAVGAYLAPVSVATTSREIEPANLRERIRQRGPTVALPGAAAVKTERHVPL